MEKTAVPTFTNVTASSLDGRHFACRGGGEIGAPTIGQIVVLRDPSGEEQVGQIDRIDSQHDGELTGAGRLLGAIHAGQGQTSLREPHPVARAIVLPAGQIQIDLLYSPTAPTLSIGTHRGASDVPARLLQQRFNRHTFWCGQSGSGKTYALGVVLEQLLLHTTLPLVIFDPNADFVRLGEPAEGTTDRRDAERQQLRSRDIRVLRPGTDNPPLVRFTDLPLRIRGAILGLDPLEDRSEYNELVHLEATVGLLEPELIVPRLVGRGTPAAVALAARIENLKVVEWPVWSGNRRTASDSVRARPDATVLDLGGFDFPEESLIVALDVLDDLWARREERRPVLLVIDEAHNFTSPEDDSRLRTAVRERLVQIAAEGRKYGIWLLLSTQRPARVHPGITSQCDNLALMKVTSPRDLDELATLFGFVPDAMLAGAATYRQGEALFAGGFVPAPLLVRMGERLTAEGGSDVAVPGRSADRAR